MEPGPASPMCANAVRMISFGRRLMTSSTGARSIRFSASSRLKDGVSRITEADVETHPDHDDAEQERDAPSPNQELIARERAKGEHRQICQKQPDRQPELWPRGNEATMLVRSRPFHRQ